MLLHSPISLEALTPHFSFHPALGSFSGRFLFKSPSFPTILHHLPPWHARYHWPQQCSTQPAGWYFGVIPPNFGISSSIVGLPFLTVFHVRFQKIHKHPPSCWWYSRETSDNQCPIPMIPGFIWVHRTAIEVLIPQSRMSWPPPWSMSPFSSCVAAEPADGFGTRKLRGPTQNLMVCHIPQPIFTQAAMDSPRCCFRKKLWFWGAALLTEKSVTCRSKEQWFRQWFDCA